MGCKRMKINVNVNVSIEELLYQIVEQMLEYGMTDIESLIRSCYELKQSKKECIEELTQREDYVETVNFLKNLVEKLSYDYINDTVEFIYNKRKELDTGVPF